MTPEGKVKAKVKKVLAEFKPIDTFWPVPSGYGMSHLDCIVCFFGRFISIETKGPGGKPTPRQELRMRSVRMAGGMALVMDGTDKTTTINQLRTMLEAIERAECNSKQKA